MKVTVLLTFLLLSFNANAISLKITSSSMLADKSVYISSSSMFADKSVYISSSSMFADLSVYISSSSMFADDEVCVSGSISDEEAVAIYAALNWWIKKQLQTIQLGHCRVDRTVHFYKIVDIKY